MIKECANTKKSLIPLTPANRCTGTWLSVPPLKKLTAPDKKVVVNGGGKEAWEETIQDSGTEQVTEANNRNGKKYSSSNDVGESRIDFHETRIIVKKEIVRIETYRIKKEDQ